MWWPLTLTYIFKVIWPWLWKLCSVASSDLSGYFCLHAVATVLIAVGAIIILLQWVSSFPEMISGYVSQNGWHKTLLILPFLFHDSQIEKEKCKWYTHYFSANFLCQPKWLTWNFPTSDIQILRLTKTDMPMYLRENRVSFAPCDTKEIQNSNICIIVYFATTENCSLLEKDVISPMSFRSNPLQLVLWQQEIFWHIMTIFVSAVNLLSYWHIVYCMILCFLVIYPINKNSNTSGTMQDNIFYPMLSDDSLLIT